jgi:hypothetical protein
VCRLWVEIKYALNPHGIVLPGGVLNFNPQESERRQLEQVLQASQELSLPEQTLIVGETLRRIGSHDLAVQVSRLIPFLVSKSDPMQGTLLGRAKMIEARSLESLNRLDEADMAFVMAEHLHTLAGRAMR